MAVERVVVSPEEISQVEVSPGNSPSGEDLGNAGMGVGRPGLGGPGRGPSAVPIAGYRKLPSPVPLWARILLSFLVLVLPLLCVLTIILRIAFRSQPPRVKYAWVSFLATLLTISGFLTVGAAVVVISLVPVPVLVNTGLPDLDEKSQFPDLPSAADLTSSEASAKLKPLVIVVSPATRLWNRQEVPSGSFGAGVLLHADRDGYLFATANHVADSGGTGLNTSQWSRSAGKNSDSGPNHALIATAAGIWATGNVVAQAPELDLALLWIPRHGNGTAPEFVQPIAPARDGEGIFVIGHPEGLKYTLSTGIVSGLRDESVQISAAVSPGNSGGPVYDSRGNLVGIVSSKFDHNRDANAENLSFAAKADAILRPSAWVFKNNGAKLLDEYLAASKRGSGKSADAQK